METIGIFPQWLSRSLCTFSLNGHFYSPALLHKVRTVCILLRKQVIKVKEINRNMDSMFQEHSNKDLWESSLNDDRSDREGNDNRVGPYKKRKNKKGTSSGKALKKWKHAYSDESTTTQTHYKYQVNKIQHGIFISGKSTGLGAMFFLYCLWNVWSWTPETLKMEPRSALIISELWR